MQTIIKYKKNRRYFNLAMIILWFVLIACVLIFDDKARWTSWGWMIMGTIYTVVYTNNLFNNYLTVKDNEIIENAFFEKRIKLDEVVSFKSFFGDYILKTDKKELVINTQIIDPQSLEVLDNYLSRYEHLKVEEVR